MSSAGNAVAVEIAGIVILPKRIIYIIYGNYNYHMVNSQNIYEYNRVKPLDKESIMSDINEWKSESAQNRAIIRIINKLNELVIEQNHLMKDFELYKKAFKYHVGGQKSFLQQLEEIRAEAPDLYKALEKDDPVYLGIDCSTNNDTISLTEIKVVS